MVNITGSPDITLFEFDEAAKKIREEIGGNDAIIKVGTAFQKELQGKIRVSIFATGLKEQNEFTGANLYQQNSENDAEEDDNKFSADDDLLMNNDNQPQENIVENNDDFFDTGVAIVVDDFEEKKPEKQHSFFGDLFGFSSKNDKPKKQKIEEKNNVFKARNREIEIQSNYIDDNLNDKNLNIPSYLRKKKNI